MSLPKTNQQREHLNFKDNGDGTTSRYVWTLNGGGGSGSANTTPAISILSMASANTEYSFALPANCKGFVFRSRKIARIKLSFVTGMVNYVTIPSGGFWSESNFYTAQSIFLESSVGSNEIEIVTYI